MRLNKPATRWRRLECCQGYLWWTVQLPDNQGRGTRVQSKYLLQELLSKTSTILTTQISRTVFIQNSSHSHTL
jgi:hypothetical protein